MLLENFFECMEVDKFSYCCFGILISLYTLWANAADDKLELFSYFSKETKFDISCKLFPQETVFMKCQILFCRKIKKKIFQNVAC